MASKYDRYKQGFILDFCAGKVETFTEFAKKKKWIKRSLSEATHLTKFAHAWTEEAMTRITQITEVAQKRLEKEYEITMDEALKAKRAVFAVMMKRLKKRGEKLSAHELKMIWEVAKTEAGQPSKITTSRIGEDKENPFTTLADALNATAASHANSTVDEEPPA